MHERNRILKEQLLSVKPEICSRRAVLYTESYKETEEQPVIIRRAKGFEKVVNEVPIYIQEWELIVGNIAEKPRGAPIFLEYDYEWVLKEMDEFEKRPGDVYLCSEETKRTLKESFQYWEGKTLNRRVMQYFDGACCLFQDGKIYHQGGIGHFSADYEKILRVGFNGIIAEAEKGLSQLELWKPEDFRKKFFLEAVIITSKAAIDYAKRYADLARREAANAEPKRREELLRIAEICDWIPANPARNFYEALQSFYFTQNLLLIESNHHSISPGRFDQYMYPFYEKDINEGKITRDSAYELLECLWIKLASFIKVFDWPGTCYFRGYQTWQNLGVGGLKRDGSDATNELSYIILDITGDMKLICPSVSARIHVRSPEDFLIKCVETINKHRGGMPALHNDHAYIPALMAYGIPKEDANDWSVIGCIEAGPQGKGGGWAGGLFYNVLKCLEVALSNGRCSESAKRACPSYQKEICEKISLGPAQGDLTTYTSFDQLLEAFERQLEYAVQQGVTYHNVRDLAHQEIAPLPYTSSLIDGCLRNGKDVTEGGATYPSYENGNLVGLANVADALASIKRLIFEEKKITGAELKQALDTNFEGSRGEEIYYMLRNDAPKYGNDDDNVDSLAREVSIMFANAHDKYRNIFGGKLFTEIVPVSSNVPLGSICGASPDGRRAGMPTAEGCSPVQGMDRNSPTLAMKSVSKLEHLRYAQGTLLNLKFNPRVLETRESLVKLAALARAYFALGGMHVQFNIVSADTLRDAKAHPEKYRDLLVRVAGYSAYFTTLDPVIQDDIISRTEHTQ